MIQISNFSLTDIDELVISSRRKNRGLDPTGEYDISYYENYIKENIIILSNFIKETLDSINSIQDEKIKQRLIIYVKHDLIKLYENNINKNKNVKEDEKKYSGSNIGYFATHKFSEFIQRDMIALVLHYDRLIDFMNNVYMNYKTARKKMLPDMNILYEIFANSKLACSNFGISSSDAESLYDSITSPYKEHSILCETRITEDEENSMDEDISISSLPYYVTVPSFTAYSGASKEEVVINDRASVRYNKSYLQKQPIR